MSSSHLELGIEGSASSHLLCRTFPGPQGSERRLTESNAAFNFWAALRPCVKMISKVIAWLGLGLGGLSAYFCLVLRGKLKAEGLKALSSVTRVPWVLGL